MTLNFVYNGYGQRVKKIVNGVTTIFHYNLDGQIIAESNSAGTITAEYVYLYGQPLLKLQGGNTYYYHNDHLGTPQMMTDANRQVVWQADYNPFGGLFSINAPVTNNLRFPGQYYDQETGLSYNYARDYNSAIGRYIQADRVGILGGINIYRYASSNPIGRTDPFGLWTPSGHENITRDVLSIYGDRFTGPMRNVIVEANVLVDQNQFNNTLHYMPDKEHDPKGLIPAAHIELLLERAVNARLAGDLYESMYALGEALHTLQDESAHFEQGAGWWEHLTGNPDDPAAHPFNYSHAYKETVDLIDRYFDQLKKSRASCGK